MLLFDKMAQNKEVLELNIIRILLEKDRTLRELTIELYGELIPQFIFKCPKCNNLVYKKITNEFNENSIKSGRVYEESELPGVPLSESFCYDSKPLNYDLEHKNLKGKGP